MVSPVNASYGMVGPVNWNGPGGRLSTFVMRVSGPSVKASPVPPVPKRNWSWGDRPGSPPGMLRMAAYGDTAPTPPTSGAGSVAYSDLLFRSALLKNFPPFGAEVIWN